MVYKYNPCNPCCGGCDFVDNFDAAVSGYTDSIHSSVPVFSLSSSVLSLSGGDASRHRQATFDADANEGGFAVIGTIEAGSGRAGVFVGGQYAFAADWSGNRFIAFPCDATGAQTGDVVVVGTQTPAAGRRVELRIGWSDLLDSWKVLFYVDGIVQPAVYTATLTGSAHVFGLVGTAGAKWRAYQQDCTASLSSVVLCVEGYATECVEVDTGNPTFHHWSSLAEARFAPNGVGASVFMDIIGTDSTASHLLVGRNFGIVIPDEATITQISCAARYKISNAFPSDRQDVGDVRLMNGAAYIPPLLGFTGKLSSTTFVEHSPVNFLSSLPSQTVVESSAFGFALRVTTVYPNNVDHTVYVDSMRLRVCYRINF